VSELDEIKEEIGFYKTAWTFVLTVLAGLVGWFMLYGKQDATSGIALLGIIVMVGLWMWLQVKIMNLIRSLRNL
jgi:hypothetical protein